MLSLFDFGLVELSCSVLAIAFLIRLGKRKLSLPLPPGPKKLPVIGNLLDVPTSKIPQTYAEWSKLYGTS